MTYNKMLPTVFFLTAIVMSTSKNDLYQSSRNTSIGNIVDNGKHNPLLQLNAATEVLMFSIVFRLWPQRIEKK